MGCGSSATANATVSVVVRKTDGWESMIELARDETVKHFKQKVLTALGPGLKPYLLRLCFDGKVLEDPVVIGTLGLRTGSEVSLACVAEVPRWAEEQGFKSSHCDWLREHFKGTAMEAEEFLSSDELIWQQLEESQAKREADKAESRTFGHQLWLEVGGQRVDQIMVLPGIHKEITVKGWVWNHSDSPYAKHQLLLATGTTHLTDLYEGEPKAPRQVHFKEYIRTPVEYGIHMLYSYQDLQHEFQAARANFATACQNGTLLASLYPDHFVGWLVVDKDAPF
jgi:hypothetical protein